MDDSHVFLSRKLSQDEIDNLFEKIDVNKDSVLNLHEMEKVFGKKGCTQKNSESSSSSNSSRSASAKASHSASAADGNVTATSASNKAASESAKQTPKDESLNNENNETPSQASHSAS